MSPIYRCLRILKEGRRGAANIEKCVNVIFQIKPYESPRSSENLSFAGIALFCKIIKSIKQKQLKNASALAMYESKEETCSFLNWIYTVAAFLYFNHAKIVSLSTRMAIDRVKRWKRLKAKIQINSIISRSSYKD